MILLSIGLLINFGKRKVEYKRLYHPNYHAVYDPANLVIHSMEIDFVEKEN